MTARTFRNRTYPVIGWAIAAPLGLGALLSAATAAGETSVADSFGLLLLAAACAVAAWVILRVYVWSCVRAGSDGVVVVNPLSKRTLAWRDIDRFSADMRLWVHPKNGEPIGVFAVQAANASRFLSRESHADHVAQDLNAMLVESQGGHPAVEGQYGLSPGETAELRRRMIMAGSPLLVILLVKLFTSIR